MEKQIFNAIAFMAIFSFILMPFTAINGSADLTVHDYSANKDFDFRMGNTYVDNVDFVSIDFEPNQTFDLKVRSNADSDAYLMSSRMMRDGNDWFNYRFSDNDLIFYETEELFIYVDDNEEDMREHTMVNPQFTDNERHYPITFFNNDTYYLYMESNIGNHTDVYYGTNATNLTHNATIEIGVNDGNVFGEEQCDRE